MKVKCPKCGTEKEIIGTEERVRCINKDDCGKRYYIKGNIVPEKKDSEGQKRTPKPQRLEYNGMVRSLIIALNYAINTIKNKKSVKECDINSTWYIYWREWTRIRKYFQSLESDKDGK